MKYYKKLKKIIDIENIDNTKMSIDIDEVLPNYVTLKDKVILTICVIKEYGRNYP